METEKTNHQKLEELVEVCNKQAKKFQPIKKYLNDRLINDDIIDIFKIGYGMFWGKRWIVIPIYDIDGNLLYLKLRKDPNDKSNKRKYVYYPEHSKAAIYGVEEVLRNETLMITEGEFDRLVAMSKGIPAITTTSGVTGFKKEWYKVDETGVGFLSGLKKLYICFDMDKPGVVASEKLAESIQNEYPSLEIFLTTLPAIVNGKNMPESGADLTDYFKLDGDIDELMYNHSPKYERRIEDSLEPVKTQSFDFSQKENSDFSPSDVELAKMADISHLIRDINKRDPSGKLWLNCPFHNNDDTPSCVIYPNGGGWFCFAGCGGGDYIDFIMRYNNVEFKEAVKLILNKQ